MTLHVGFTGTRKGMTFVQRRTLRDLLWDIKATDFEHGDCVGADEQAHAIANVNRTRIHIRPCTITDQRAFCITRLGIDIHYPPKPPIERNHDIVDASHVLIATPGEMAEQLRSGTWSTVRYARKRGKRVIIIFPDGSVSDSGEVPDALA